MAVFLGIDAGTTNLKAILADENGGILGSSSCPARVLTPFEGANEMDMNALWKTLCELTLRLRDCNPQAFGKLEGMGISAQGDGLWPVGADGGPVGNAILWNDLRTRELDGTDKEELDRLLVRNASNALFAGASPLILKWISQKQPERFEKIHRAVRCKDWLNFKLTGRLVSDCTDYSTGGINILTKQHVLEIYDFLGISQAGRMLPELVAPTGVLGTVSAEASRQSGIPAGIPVIAGALDVVATAMGAGVTKAGDGCVVLGTTLCSDILIDAEQVDVSARGGSTLCSIMPNKFVRLMAALSGNTTIDWAKSVLAPDLTFTQLESELEKVPPGSRGILYHPYIGGERAPFRNPFACAGFYGLNAQHTRFDMMRAVYEGMALSLKDCHKALPKADGRIYLAGGGSVSDFTCGLVAHALGRRVSRPNKKELAARGIVEAVKLGLGMPPGSGVAGGGEDIFEPAEALCGQYDVLYSRFTALRERMGPYWVERGRTVPE